MTNVFIRLLIAALCLSAGVVCAQDDSLAASQLPAERTAKQDPAETDLAEPQATVRIECRLLQVLQVDIERDWTASLSGSTAYVEGKIDSLVMSGAIIQSNRLHLTAVSGQTAMVQSGIAMSVVTGEQTVRNSVQRIMQRQQIGILLECTPIVHDDNSITLKLTFEKSDIPPGITSTEEGEQEKIEAPTTITMTTKSQLQLVSGTGGVLSGISQDTGERPNQWLLVVFAELAQTSEAPLKQLSK